MASLKTSGRWSRVSRSAPRRAPDAAEEDSGGEDLSGPEQAPAGAKPKAGRAGPRSARRSPRARKGRPSADSLLAKLRESGLEGATESPQDSEPPATSNVDSAPSPGESSPKGRKPRRRADANWSKAREAERASAQQVLQRILRSGDRAEEAPPVETTQAPEAPPVVPPKTPVPVDVGPPPPEDEEDAAPPEAAPEDPEKTDAPASKRTSSAPPPRRKSKSPPPRRRKASDEGEAANTEAPAASATVAGWRSPEPVPGGGTLPTELRSYRLTLVEGERGLKVRLPASTDVASAVGRIVGTMIPAPIDGLGQLSGWYRLDGPEGPLAATSHLSEVPDKASLGLRFVANRPVTVELLVHAEDGERRLRTVLGSAVPVASLVDHLSRWLELPRSGWRLSAGGDVLGPHAILADLAVPEGGLLVELGPAKKKRRRRR